MDTGVTRETIKGQVDELNGLLVTLVENIHQLIERNPKPTGELKADVPQQPDNVFDEIADTLRDCKGRVRQATEDVIGGIANKVH